MSLLKIKFDCFLVSSYIQGNKSNQRKNSFMVMLTLQNNKIIKKKAHKKVHIILVSRTKTNKKKSTIKSEQCTIPTNTLNTLVSSIKNYCDCALAKQKKLSVINTVCIVTRNRITSAASIEIVLLIFTKKFLLKEKTRF